MALNQVQYVQAPPKETTTGGRKGGGAIGSKIGAVVGGVAGGIAGAAGTAGSPAGAVVGAAGGAGAGASAGNMLGEMIKPTREGTTAIERRIDATGPQMVQSDTAEKLKQSLFALQTQPEDVRERYSAPLLTAYAMSQQKGQV